MAPKRGRGRGFGRTSDLFTFDVKSLIADDLRVPDRESESPSLFPPLLKLPLPLRDTETDQYCAKVRQAAVDRCRSMYYIGSLNKKEFGKIRYPNKITGSGRDYFSRLHPKTKQLLCGKIKRKIPINVSKSKLSGQDVKKKGIQDTIDEEKDVDDAKQDDDIRTSGKTSKQKGEIDDDDDDDDDDVNFNEEEEDEEEQVTDYISSYFDNGEDYLGGDDENEDNVAW